MCSIILFISGGEIFFILFAILILFGAKRIPEMAKGLGKGLKEFRKVTNDIKKEISEETEIIKDLNEIKDTFKK